MDVVLVYVLRVTCVFSHTITIHVQLYNGSRSRGGGGGNLESKQGCKDQESI